MRSTRRLAAAAALTATAFLAATGTAAAGIWTQVPTGISDTISAVDYHADGKLWFATTNGKLAYRKADGSFGYGTGVPGGVQFTDVAFRDDGNVGLAVGLSGNVWRTTNGGQSWTQVALPATINNDDCFDVPDPGTSTFNDAYSVKFATADTVYVTGDRGNILRSQSAGASFLEINKKVDDGCRIGGAFYQGAVTSDAAFLNATRGYFIARGFGHLAYTENGLADDGILRSTMINKYDGVPRIAVDPSNPNRLWAVDRGVHELAYSDNGGVSARVLAGGELTFTAPGEQSLREPHDIAYAGGTVLLAGSQAQIVNSVDGENFHLQNADAPLADWKAVDLADATRGVVAGTGGTLLVTNAANTLPPPPTPPTPPTPPSPPTPPTPRPTTPTPQRTTNTATARVPGATIRFQTPSSCVRPGATFQVTLSWKREKKKGNRFVKVRRADFYIGSKRVKIDRAAPFRQTLKVQASQKRGSAITVRARAFIKVTRGKSPTKSIRARVGVC